MPPSPRVSVVMATYNRSAVLRYSIESVRASSFSDWELIVVGDCCTDDTAEVVASVGDPRVRFVNLTERVGDQSGPNNHGASVARGEFVAFLNHDDLYTPDHLGTCVAELERTGADLVWATGAVAHPGGHDTKHDLPCRFTLTGVTSSSGFSLWSFCNASLWVFRRDLPARIGGWRRPEASWVSPSQAWLFRVWRSGAVIRHVPKVGVILIPAGARPGCYAVATSSDHDRIVHWLKTEPRSRELLLEDAALNSAAKYLDAAHHTPLLSLLRGLLHPVHVLLTAMNIHPRSLQKAFYYWRSGGLRRRHQRNGVTSGSTGSTGSTGSRR